MTIDLAELFEKYQNGSWRPDNEPFFVTVNGKQYSKELWGEINKPLVKPLVRLELGFSSSANFNSAVSILKSMPNVTFKTQQLGLPDVGNNKGMLIAEINTIKEYAENQFQIIRFIEIASKWKNTSIILNGSRYCYIGDFALFAINLKSKSKEYSPMIRDEMNTNYRHEYIAADGEIVYERQLPLPYVYYPGDKSYFAFAANINDVPFCCECQRRLIETELNWDMFPEGLCEKYGAEQESHPIDYVKFKDGICFKCQSVVPTLLYATPMYVSNFESRYGWYMRNKAKEIILYIDGVIPQDDPIGEYARNYVKIRDEIAQIDKKYRVRYVGVKKADLCEENLRYAELSKELGDVIENAAREDLGFKRIGEAWTSETILFNIVHGLYPNSEIKRHYRPDWLDRLELDIYLPAEKMAFEYQGVQHFKPVEHWGGEKQLKKQQEHDLRKARKCAELGINLIHINYYDDLTVDNVSQIISRSEDAHF